MALTLLTSPGDSLDGISSSVTQPVVPQVPRLPVNPGAAASPEVPQSVSLTVGDESAHGTTVVPEMRVGEPDKAPATQATIALADTALATEGLPQDTAPPVAYTSYFGPGDWEIERAVREDAVRRQLASPKLKEAYRLALDRDRAFKPGDFGAHPDPEREKSRFINDTFMRDHTGHDVPGDVDSIQRGLIRQEIAFELFDGRGADSEEAFFLEVRKAAEDEKVRADTERANLRPLLMRHLVQPYMGTDTRAQILSGHRPGVFAMGKGFFNEKHDLKADVAGALFDSGGDTTLAIRQVRDIARKQRQNGSSPYNPYQPMNALPLAESLEADWSDQVVAQLEKMQKGFDQAGIPVEERRDLILDTVKATAWTENDEDTFRVLSTGRIVINPGRVYGQREEIIAGIRSTNSSEEEKHDAILRLDAMRREMAEEIDSNNAAADGSDSWSYKISAGIMTAGRYFFQENYRDFVSKQNEAGVYDKPTILDAWNRNQEDRNWVFKMDDAILTGATTGTIGVYKTGVGTAAGLSAVGAEAGRFIGADGAADVLDHATVSLAKEQMFLGDATANLNKASEFRGVTERMGSRAISPPPPPRWLPCSSADMPPRASRGFPRRRCATCPFTAPQPPRVTSPRRRRSSPTPVTGKAAS